LKLLLGLPLAEEGLPPSLIFYQIDLSTLIVDQIHE